MEFPVEIGFGDFQIKAHLIFEILAFTLSFRYYLHQRKKSNDAINETNRIWLIIGAAFGAFLLSRLVGSLEAPHQWWSSESKLLSFFATKTIVGGLFGGLIGVEIMKKAIGIHQSSGDLFVFPIILGMIIGRIGCFTMGIYEETYGVTTSLPWGMDLGDGLTRHPVTLYEIIFLTFIWLLFRFIQSKWQLKNGLIFQFFMIAYAVFRLCLDFIKPGLRFGFGLGAIQITCLVILLYYGETIYNLLLNRTQLMADDPN